MKINISNLRSLFGDTSAIAKAASFVDTHSPDPTAEIDASFRKYPGAIGGRYDWADELHTERSNDRFDEREVAVFNDPLCPTDVVAERKKLALLAGNQDIFGSTGGRGANYAATASFAVGEVHSQDIYPTETYAAKVLPTRSWDATKYKDAAHELARDGNFNFESAELSRSTIESYLAGKGKTGWEGDRYRRFESKYPGALAAMEKTFKTQKRTVTERPAPTKELVSKWAGTALEAAVKSLISHQTGDKSALKAATVFKYASSALFEQQFPGAMSELKKHFSTGVKVQPTHQLPPATVDKVLVKNTKLTATLRLNNTVPSSVYRGGQVDLVLKTKPNAIIGYVPLSNQNLGFERLSDGAHSPEPVATLLRADAQGNVVLPSVDFRPGRIWGLDGETLSPIFNLNMSYELPPEPVRPTV